MNEQKDGSIKKRKVFYILFTIALSAVLFAFYRFSLFIGFFFPVVMWVYIVALAVLTLTYIFYNRGFLRKGVTVEMLPLEWKEEKKRDFVRDAEDRIKRSAWMLSFMVSFFATFLLDAFELFVLPVFIGWFR